jgi:hypothetical protein
VGSSPSIVAILRVRSLFRNSREQFRSKQKRSQNKTGQKFSHPLNGVSFWLGFIQIKGLTQPVPVSGANPDALTFSHGDKMYEYTVFAKVANKEVALKTFFDDLDDKPMEKAKALVEANKGKFRSLRIEKRITPML